MWGVVKEVLFSICWKLDTCFFNCFLLPWHVTYKIGVYSAVTISLHSFTTVQPNHNVRTIGMLNMKPGLDRSELSNTMPIKIIQTYSFKTIIINKSFPVSFLSFISNRRETLCRPLRLQIDRNVSHYRSQHRRTLSRRSQTSAPAQRKTARRRRNHERRQRRFGQVQSIDEETTIFKEKKSFDGPQSSTWYVGQNMEVAWRRTNPWLQSQVKVMSRDGNPINYERASNHPIGVLKHRTPSIFTMDKVLLGKIRRRNNAVPGCHAYKAFVLVISSVHNNKLRGPYRGRRRRHVKIQKNQSN